MGESSQNSLGVDEDGGLSLADQFEKHLEEENNLMNKYEVERYLAEGYEPNSKNDKFDLLDWWKNNSSRYKILFLVARDVLAIPVSSVASESAFSIGGRLLDHFRSSLSPTVEALICTQDWLRSSMQPINLREAMDDVEELEKIDLDVFGGSASHPSFIED